MAKANIIRLPDRRVSTENKANKKGKGRKAILITDMKERWNSLRNEVGDFEPDAFNRIEKHFFEILSTGDRSFISLCVKDLLKAGKCPAREWLKFCGGGYPIDEFEKEFLLFCRILEKRSHDEYLALWQRFFIKFRNSGAFRKHCHNLRRAGINPAETWLEEHHFKPVFKAAPIDVVK